ncbi:ROK family protein [Nonomuraea sp. NPDC003707]
MGIEIGRRHIATVICDAGYKEIGHNIKTAEELGCGDDDIPPEQAIHQAAKVVLPTLLAKVEHQPQDVLGVAIGIPAPVTRDGAILTSLWRTVEIESKFASLTRDGTVLVSNEANLGGLGEAVFGAGQGSHDLVYVKAGTGVGAGYVHDGRLVRGAAGTAGEFGHITVDFRGPFCWCGARGCLEVYAGGASLVNRARKYLPDLRNLGHLVAKANGGDPLCQRLIADSGSFLGIGLGTIVNLNSPDTIVVGGALSRARDILLAPLKESLARTAIPAALEKLEVVLATLARDEYRASSALGGVVLVLKNLPRKTAMP